MKPEYDVLIMTTAQDFLRLKNNYHRLIKNMPARRWETLRLEIWYSSCRRLRE